MKYYRQKEAIDMKHSWLSRINFRILHLWDLYEIEVTKKLKSMRNTDMTTIITIQEQKMVDTSYR